MQKLQNTMLVHGCKTTTEEFAKSYWSSPDKVAN